MKLAPLHPATLEAFVHMPVQVGTTKGVAAAENPDGSRMAKVKLVAREVLAGLDKSQKETQAMVVMVMVMTNLAGSVQGQMKILGCRVLPVLFIDMTDSDTVASVRNATVLVPVRQALILSVTCC